MILMLHKLPIVGVFGQGSPISAERARLAHEVGALVAELGVHLLTGGGFGVMEAAAEGFVGIPGRVGLSIGVVPRDLDGPFDLPDHDLKGRRYPNPFVEIAIMTPLPPLVPDWRHTPVRNHVNVLTADAIIALPGNDGTRNELDMAAEYGGETDRPRENRRTILIGPIEQFFSRHRELFVHAATLGEAEVHLRRALATRGQGLEKKP
jgi:uncharacterized protein (TIGR00725 family)